VITLRVRLNEKDSLRNVYGEVRDPDERRMTRHCRHCLGDCPGECLIGDSGRCIHGWHEKRPRQFSWQLLLTRRWWHRVFWGAR
jgi:hypothetical protein